MASMSERDALTREAREFLRGSPFGVLATISLALPGYPFGSVAPYALDHDGEPLILISDLAQHTQNIKRDPRVSLLVLDAAVDDPHPEARLTWVGDAAPVGEDAAAQRRYLNRHPHAADYFDTHDFALYRIACRRVRYIGGFGRITWIEPLEIRQANPLREAEEDILAHMNADHGEAMRVYCQAFKELVAPQEARMTGIDAEGCEVLADGRLVRFAFADPVNTPEEARRVLVDMARRARAAAAG